MVLISIEELERMSPVFRGRAGNAFAEFLLRALKVQKVSDIYDALSGFNGAEFARAVNEAAGLRYTVNGLCREDALEHFRSLIPEGPFITICNHPIGSLDGTILIDFFGHLRKDYMYMVNEILWRLEPLRPSLIRVTPNGNSISAPTAQSIAGVRAAREHLEKGGVLGLFPSGAVSDLKPGRRPEIPGMPNCKEPKVRDRDWQMSIIRFIAKAGVPVLPMHFLDGNSLFYYLLGLIDWRVRLLRLPSEILNKKGKTIRLAMGPVIGSEKIGAARTPEELRDLLRASVYSL